MKELKFGIAYDALDGQRSLADEFDDLVASARLAEDLGFDSIWFGETHRRKPGHGHAPSPLVLCAALAGVTTRLQLGTAALLPPMYTPLQLAEEAAVVDQLTRGRLILGVASGMEVYLDFGFDNVPFERADLRKIMDESLELVRRFWSEESVDADGYFKYAGAACIPQPFQDPRPPLLVGGITPEALRRAAKCDGWVGGTPYPFGLVKAVRERFDDARHESGGGGRGFALIRPIVVADTDQRAVALRDDYVTPLIDYYLARGAYVRSDFTFARPASEADRVQALEEIAIVGSPETCAAEIVRYVEEAGVDHFIFRVRFPGSDRDQAQQMLLAIAEDVLPRVRAAVGEPTAIGAATNGGTGGSAGA
jgi:alkanesulfonate monooxygenase SsuD/methylene tetrahydromethanopterin reductase-like flavin-dependent oxidoreductase (luciferase family)